MKKIFLAILVVCLVVGVVSFVRLSVPNNLVQSDAISQDDSLDVPILPTVESSKITSSQLSSHNKKTDCWVAYDGKVYDVTSFLPKHPGSAAAITPFCGTSDGFSKAFTNEHGTSKVSNLMRVGTLMGDFDIVGTV
ncbi:MAG: cytochrome b5 domain-containing protein [Candidatus Pacearchaeota archaeon]